MATIDKYEDYPQPGSPEDVVIGTGRGATTVADLLAMIGGGGGGGEGLTAAQLAEQLAAVVNGQGASMIGVEDAGGLFTGSTVEAILAELFTFANSGKTGLASVIGSPATAGDSFATLNGLVQTDKDTLASNLAAKGVTAAGSEALAALVAKVGNIVVNQLKYQAADTAAVSCPPYSSIQCPIPSGWNRILAVTAFPSGLPSYKCFQYRASAGTGTDVVGGYLSGVSTADIQIGSATSTSMGIQNNQNVARLFVFNAILGI